MRYTLLFLFLSFFFLNGCKNDKPQSTKNGQSAKTQKKQPQEANPARKLAESIEISHQKQTFLAKKAVRFHLNLHFNGQPQMNATISLMTNSSKVKVKKEDGTTLVYNGKNALLFPKKNRYEKADFDMWTWAYFFALPFKLTDPGTKWQDKSQDSINGEEYDTAKLTFKKGTGESPDDWYVVYADKKTDYLTAAAYIVTYGGKSQQKAAENPHAILYKNYFSVHHVPVAKTWEFYHWAKDKGIYGEPLGTATISKVKFFNPPKDFFTAPQDAVQIEE